MKRRIHLFDQLITIIGLKFDSFFANKTLTSGRLPRPLGLVLCWGNSWQCAPLSTDEELSSLLPAVSLVGKSGVLHLGHWGHHWPLGHHHGLASPWAVLLVRSVPRFERLFCLLLSTSWFFSTFLFSLFFSLRTWKQSPMKPAEIFYIFMYGSYFGQILVGCVSFLLESDFGCYFPSLFCGDGEAVNSFSEFITVSNVSLDVSLLGFKSIITYSIFLTTFSHSWTSASGASTPLFLEAQY